MLENAIRAARLDVDFYNTVERDESFTGQAALVVIVVSALTGLGNAFVLRGFVWPLIVTIVGGLIGWVAWAWITAWVGTSFFDGTTDVGEMLRVLGFAQAPLAIGVIPFLGFVGAVWSLIASVVAVREGQDFGTGQAVGTVIAGWLVLVVLRFVWFAVFT